MSDTLYEWRASDGRPWRIKHYARHAFSVVGLGAHGVSLTLPPALVEELLRLRAIERSIEFDRGDLSPATSVTTKVSIHRLVPARAFSSSQGESMTNQNVTIPGGSFARFEVDPQGGVTSGDAWTNDPSGEFYLLVDPSAPDVAYLVPKPSCPVGTNGTIGWSAMGASELQETFTVTTASAPPVGATGDTTQENVGLIAALPANYAALLATAEAAATPTPAAPAPPPASGSSTAPSGS